MPSTTNYLRDTDSLRRFIDGLSTQQTPRYLNGNGEPLHRWEITNGSGSVISSTVKLPSCNTLQISPSSASAVTLHLHGTDVLGTVFLQRTIVRYLFHSLLLCDNPLTVFTRLYSSFSPEDSVAMATTGGEFTACRSNVVVLDQENSLPSAGYQGSNVDLSVEISIEGHGGFPIYMTFPSLIDADAWRFNSFMRSCARYMPTMYRDIDEVQEPEYTFFKLIDAISHAGGDAMDVYGRWFRFEPDELPSDAEETEIWVRSSLTDGSIARSGTLPWMANTVGNPLLSQTYGIDPTTSETVGWQNVSYPLDMTTLIDVDLVSVDGVSIVNDLVVVDKWLPVIAASTTTLDTSTDIIDGAVIGGVTVYTGDRVLLKDQIATEQNGIYVVVSSGSSSRATDADNDAEFTTGKSVQVTSGIYADTYWAASVPASFTIDTSPISFAVNPHPGVVDGVDLFDTAVVLLINQVAPEENGAYLVSDSSVATRISELSTSTQLVDMTCFEAASGDAYAGSLWRLYIERPQTINVDPLQIVEVDRILDFKRSQISTAMYGHGAGSIQSIRDAAQRLLKGNRSVAISPNSPNDYYITVKTIFSETPGVDEISSWSACRVATTEDIFSLSTMVAGTTVDGVVLNASDRVLVKSQFYGAQNGIYVVNTSSPPTRAADANELGEFVDGKVVYVQEGDIFGDTYFAFEGPLSGLDMMYPVVFNRATNLGDSDAIIKAIEPTRPIGFQFIHETIDKFSFTFNSPSLGRLDQGVLR